MSAQQTPFERARAHLALHGLEGRVVVFDTSSATVELAARALGCAPGRIAKTLAFHSPSPKGRAAGRQGLQPESRSCIVLVAAGDARVDNQRFREQLGVRARMLGADEVAEATGYAAGGVCPFGLGPGARVYLDESLRRFEEVYPACGGGSSGVRLTPAELQSASGALAWVDVCRVPAPSTPQQQQQQQQQSPLPLH
eukprot:m51a1_g6923 putative proline--trna ligase associated domain protein (197) ;mRNA; f:161523-162113